MLTGKDYLSNMGSIDTIIICKFSSSLLETFLGPLKKFITFCLAVFLPFLKWKSNVSLVIF